MRQLRSAALLLLLGLSACATKIGDYPDLKGPGAAPAAFNHAATPYYVEFHSRASIISGHTYLVYGSQDEQGKEKEHNVAGFYPVGGIFGLLGGMVAAPGRVDKTFFDEKLPDMNSYRRNITAAQYQKLTDYISAEQSKTKVWNMFVNNCNDFAADAARAIGLKAPSGRFLPPALFVKNLGEINSAGADSPALEKTALNCEKNSAAQCDSTKAPVALH